MPSYQRKAASLEELREEVLLAFGPEARIVEATRVTRRGVGKWLARDEIEATVEVPEGAAPAGGVDASRLDPAGIAALLADADRGDGAPPRGPAAFGPGETSASGPEPDSRPEPVVPTTAEPAFRALLAAVERSLGVEAPHGDRPHDAEPNGARPGDAAPVDATSREAAPYVVPAVVAADRVTPLAFPELRPALAGGGSVPGKVRARVELTGVADPEAGLADADRSDADSSDADPSDADIVDAVIVDDDAAPRHVVPAAPPPPTRGAIGTIWRDGGGAGDGSGAGGSTGLAIRDPRRATPPAAGDLVLLVGLGDDAIRVAREISAGRGWPVSWVRVTSARRSGRSGTRAASRASVIADRRAALSARADALRLEREVMLAHAATLDDPFTAVAALRPDRVWAVVDASRTAEDTAEWVSRLDERVGVDGLAIVGTSFTRDRGTADRLGLPIAWEEPPEASA
jgi:hypothetical protein